MSSPGSGIIGERVSRLKFASALVLAGLLINAGLVVLLVAAISDSVLVALMTLAIMGIVISGSVLYVETFLMNASGARPLKPGEYTWLQAMLEDLSDEAGIEPPELLVADTEDRNAFATTAGGRGRVVFYSGLLHDLSRDEVRAVAAHELGHLINGDVRLAVWTEAIFWWVTGTRALIVLASIAIISFSKTLIHALDDMGPAGQFAGLLFGITGIVIGYGIGALAAGWAFLAYLMRMALFREREFLADATGVALTGRGDVFARALARIAEQPGLTSGSEALASFCIVSPFSGGNWWRDLTSTHPSTDQRIEEVLRLDEAPPSLPEPDEGGLAKFAMFLPAGAVAVVAMLALSIPLLVGSNNGNTSTGSLFVSQPSGSTLTTGPTDTALVPADSAQRAAPTSTATATPAPASPVSFGQTVSSLVAAPNEVDKWSFKANAGDIITIQMGQAGGASLNPSFRLVDPSGVRLDTAGACGGGNPKVARLMNLKLQAAGVYTVEAKGCGNEVGGYTLTVSRKPPPGSLAYGGKGAGAITIPQDYEDWLFRAAAGDIVTIRIVAQGGASLWPQFEVFDPSGAKLDAAYNCNGALEETLLNKELRFAGAYTIRVTGGCDHEHTGGYGLSLLLKPLPGTIAFGQQVIGELTLPNDYAAWKFSGRAGDIITIVVGNNGGSSLAPQFTLFDPSGVKIEEVFNCNSAAEKTLSKYKLPFSGEYAIRIKAGCDSTSRIGGYRLSLIK